MKVEYVGVKRRASKKLGSTCGKDVVLQSDLEEDDVVVILSVNKHVSCYALEGLAPWFLEQTVTRDRLPTLPETMALVTADVYKRVIDEARSRIDGFEDRLLQILRGFSTTRRTFVETGSTFANLSDAELFALLPDTLDEEDPLDLDDLVNLYEGRRRSRRRRRRSRRRSRR